MHLYLVLPFLTQERENSSQVFSGSVIFLFPPRTVFICGSHLPNPLLSSPGTGVEQCQSATRGSGSGPSLVIAVQGGLRDFCESQLYLE